MSSFLSQIRAKLNAFCSLLFGSLHWTSPPWLSYFCKQALRRPKLFWSLFVIFLVVFGFSWYRLKTLAQAPLIEASVLVPKATPLAEKLIPNPLRVHFGIKTSNNFISQSVAPLNAVGREVSKGILIYPKMPGTWVWSSDSSLVFTPKQDWPAGQNYDLFFDKSIFAPTTIPIKVHYNYHFSTEKFKASIREFKFYQDPVNPKIK